MIDALTKSRKKALKILVNLALIILHDEFLSSINFSFSSKLYENHFS